jgi:hypothetical protein
VSRTGQKLSEAAFFFAKLEEQGQDIEELFANKNAQDVFCYFLSAFVSAARSVAWIMRSECCKLTGWESWWKAQETEAPKQLLRIFNDIRVRSEKSDPLQLSYSIRFEDDGGAAIKPNQRLSKLQMTIEGLAGETEIRGSPRRVDGLALTVAELEGEDLIDNCRAYLQDLQRLVAACESRFGAERTAKRCL